MKDSIPSRFLKEIPAELIEEVGTGSVLGTGRSGLSSLYGKRLAALTKPAPAAGTGAEQLGLKPGDAVMHDRFGAGVVTHVEGEGQDARAEVRFPERGTKRFLLALTPLRKVTAGEARP